VTTAGPPTWSSGLAAWAGPFAPNNNSASGSQPPKVRASHCGTWKAPRAASTSITARLPSMASRLCWPQNEHLAAARSARNRPRQDRRHRYALNVARLRSPRAPGPKAPAVRRGQAPARLPVSLLGARHSHCPQRAHDRLPGRVLARSTIGEDSAWARRRRRLPRAALRRVTCARFLDWGMPDGISPVRADSAVSIPSGRTDAQLGRRRPGTSRRRPAAASRPAGVPGPRQHRDRRQRCQNDPAVGTSGPATAARCSR
jgi:hypothetical protein